MNLYFVKATFTNNVYKLSDFYTGDNYIQNAMKMLSMVFKADDGVSSIIVPNKLPDNTNVRNYTHIMIPELQKIYRIIATDYWNTDQYQLTLDDDPLIANYVELKNKNIILNRTNDILLFRGINDISDMSTKREIVPLRSGNPKSIVGGWGLLFFESSKSLTINFKFNSSLSIFDQKFSETFATFADLVAAYPEVTTLYPQTYSYFMKEAMVGAVSYQCQWRSVGGPSRLVWVKYTDYVKTVTVNTASIDYYYKSNASDLKMWCFAFPLLTNVKASSGGNIIPSFKHLIDFDNDEFLYDIKIVDDTFINMGSITQAYDNATKEGDLTLNMLSVNDAIMLTFSKTIVDVSRDATSIPLDYAPFKKHYLQIYGNRVEISPRYFDKLKLMMSISTGQINYTLYYDTIENIIGSGSFTNQTKWSIDQLEKFYSQNPTYKDQFYLKMLVDTSKTALGGAIAGSVVPGIGTAVGLLGGLAGGLVDAGLSQINLNMQEKGLRLQPDQIKGNNADLPLQLISKFGIFWVVESTINGGGLEEMTLEYSLRGFPTSLKTTINTLVARSNSFFNENVKIVYGTLKEVVKNEYVTGFINAKLANGVIII